MTRYSTPDGGRVDVITLTGTGRDEDGQWLRVTGPHGNHVGQVRTAGELAGLGVSLADMRETGR
jgi:hypothetical protein